MRTAVRVGLSPEANQAMRFLFVGEQLEVPSSQQNCSSNAPWVGSVGLTTAWRSPRRLGEDRLPLAMVSAARAPWVDYTLLCQPFFRQDGKLGSTVPDDRRGTRPEPLPSSAQDATSSAYCVASRTLCRSVGLEETQVPAFIYAEAPNLYWPAGLVGFGGQLGFGGNAAG